MYRVHRQLLLNAATVAVVVLTLFPTMAHAYIDPGSGSLIWQVLIAALLTIGFLARKYLRRFLGLGRAQETDDEPDDEPDGDQPDEPS